MMVQSAPEGDPRFISFMAEHNDLCGQFARAFGNDEFERPEPYDEMIYVISHHDFGWADFDGNPTLDPKSRLPAGLTTTPVLESVATGRKSPDYNQRRHAYCGLLASMHMWGLYNERRGYTNFSTRGGSKSIPIFDKYAGETNAMLDGELERQERLKAELAADPETRAWVEKKHLLQNYKQLQFFDTLALYFNLRHEDERGEEIYTYVPKNADEDATITLTPQGNGVYSLSPFPFAGDRVAFPCSGRYVSALPEADEPDDLGGFLRTLPIETQVHTFVTG